MVQHYAKIAQVDIEQAHLGQAAVQCNSAPKYITCYVSGPGGLVYVLEPEGSGWSVWAGS